MPDEIKWKSLYGRRFGLEFYWLQKHYIDEIYECPRSQCQLRPRRMMMTFCMPTPIPTSRVPMPFFSRLFRSNFYAPHFCSVRTLFLGMINGTRRTPHRLGVLGNLLLCCFAFSHCCCCRLALSDIIFEIAPSHANLVSSAECYKIGTQMLHDRLTLDGNDGQIITAGGGAFYWSS